MHIERPKGNARRGKVYDVNEAKKINKSSDGGAKNICIDSTCLNCIHYCLDALCLQDNFSNGCSLSSRVTSREGNKERVSYHQQKSDQ